MFDTLPAGIAELRGSADAAALLDSAVGWARVGAAAEAQRLACVAELAALRLAAAGGDTSLWACDEWDAVCAEIGAAFGISDARARDAIEVGAAMRERFPKLAAAFLRGEVTARVVATIVDRTTLVQDPEALELIDTACVEAAATRWGALSHYKLKHAIDLWVDRYDPGAVRRARDNVRGRRFTVGDANEESGTTAVYGRLSTPGAALLWARVRAMANGVCTLDPRTVEQRCADALEALGADANQLACQCGSPACTAGADDSVAAHVVVHIYAEEAALAAQPDPLMNGEWTAPEDDEDTGEGEPQPDTEPDTEADETSAPAAGSTEAATVRKVRPPAGLISGFGIVPAPLLAALIKAGAKVRYVTAPGVVPEERYRPLRALDEFVRSRDLTCRFPGCDRPAQFCDLDHTIAYADGGPTHASNLKPYCRKHHLVKTFWDGWSDIQHPDGSILLTSPTGHTYTTQPGSRLFFPTVNTTTATITITPDRPDPRGGGDKTAMMPKRKRTRTQTRAYRVQAERALNDAHVAERNKPPPF